ncbi:hypothetical protein Mp_3g19190 [Marchantia polymorpha subsp. ruderalis]|uniref:Uncharacterized protein n=2 Tax=Marchantia polymorpha TaxID=3197 RepID=A0AAF6B2G8_MARPO|nr:hypothetical protein MARPO_0049s0115 [Marchantia polymorpha]BBN06202.1 hypothetical protein Mp_3g19190 [Marchantia polymorpha subsp. ruderalis]|eukprot:PTQ38841.1 hypothetical protein MARPO_0049s0115 [Marchantia polymorpha]
MLPPVECLLSRTTDTSFIYASVRGLSGVPLRSANDQSTDFVTNFSRAFAMHTLARPRHFITRSSRENFCTDVINAPEFCASANPFSPSAALLQYCPNPLAV